MSLQTGGMNQLMGRIANEESIFIGGQLITAIDFQAARSGESLLRFWLIKAPLLRNQGLQFCRWVLDELSSAGDQCVRAKSKIPIVEDNMPDGRGIVATEPVPPVVAATTELGRAGESLHSPLIRLKT